MGYQIGNLGPGRQSGNHRAKAIEKYPDTGVELATYGYSSMVEQRTDNPYAAGSTFVSGYFSIMSALWSPLWQLGPRLPI